MFLRLLKFLRNQKKKSASRAQKKLKYKKTTINFKLNFNNMFNYQSLNIATNGNITMEGKIARNEIYGYPLPGRTWSFDLELKF